MSLMTVERERERERISDLSVFALGINSDFDPEWNCLKNVIRNCVYCGDDRFQNTFNLKYGLSIIHFNSQSLYANFQNIKDCVSSFKASFSVIAISGTWLCLEKSVDFQLEGLEYLKQE